jgi:hypothetical protein
VLAVYLEVALVAPTYWLVKGLRVVYRFRYSDTMMTIENEITPDECSTFRVIFLYSEDLYISKQYGSKSGSKALFFTRIFACGKPRRNEAPLLDCVADAVLGS